MLSKYGLVGCVFTRPQQSLQVYTLCKAQDNYFVPLLETVHVNCLGTSLKLVDNMSMSVCIAIIAL